MNEEENVNLANIDMSGNTIVTNPNTSPAPTSPVVPVAVSTDTSTPNTEQEPKKKKKKGKKVFIIIILIMLVCIIGFGAYYYLNNLIVPKKVFTDSINTLYSEIESKTNSLKNYSTIDVLNEPLTLKLTGTLNGKLEDLVEVNSANYTIDLGVDLKNENGIMGASVTLDNGSIIEGLVAIDDNVYLKTNLIDKIINLGTTEENNISIGNIFDILSYLDDMDEYCDDTLKIISSLKDIIINSLDEEKFTTTTSELSISNQVVKVKKITYNYDLENMERTIKYIQDEISKDTELSELLEKYNITIESDTTFEDEEISLYVDSSLNVVGFDVSSNNTILLEFTYLNEELNGHLNDPYIKFNYKDDTLNIDYYESEDYTEPSIILSIGEDINLKLNTTTDEESITLNIDLTDIESTDAHFSTNYNISYSSGNDTLNLTGSLSITNDELTSFDTNGAINKSDLTEDDMNTIANNLLPIIQALNINILDYVEDTPEYSESEA